MAKSPAGSSALFRAAFLVLVLAFILQIIGFTSPNWTEVSLGDYMASRTGLWKTCIEMTDIRESSCTETIYKGLGWFVAVQTFESIGLACLTIAIIISFVLLVAVNNQRLAKVNVYICVFAGVFIIMGTASYAYRTELAVLGYAYWMCWLSTCALVVAIILMECARKKSSAREMAAGRVDVVTDESQGYHSYPMQQRYTRHKPTEMHTTDESS